MKNKDAIKRASIVQKRIKAMDTVVLASQQKPDFNRLETRIVVSELEKLYEHIYKSGSMRSAERLKYVGMLVERFKSGRPFNNFKDLYGWDDEVL